MMRPTLGTRGGLTVGGDDKNNGYCSHLGRATHRGHSRQTQDHRICMKFTLYIIEPDDKEVQPHIRFTYPKITMI